MSVDSSTDLLRFTARRLADDIRKEVEQAGSDIGWLHEIEIAADECEDIIHEAWCCAYDAVQSCDSKP